MSVEAHTTMADAAIPASLEAYVATRTDDPVAAIAALVPGCPPSGLWTPVTGSLAASAGMSPCRYDARLLLRHDGAGLSAVITASRWSVTLFGPEAWVDVEWPSEAIAMWLEGKPVRTQIDFPFLSPTLIVGGSEMVGSSRRFHCREGGGDG